MKTNFNRNLIWHVLAVTAFLILPLTIAPHPRRGMQVFFHGPGLRDLLANVLMIVFFYTNYFFFIRKFYLQKKYAVYTVIISLSLLVIMILPSLLTGFVPWSANTPMDPPVNMQGSMQNSPPDNNFLFSISHNLLLFLPVILFSIFLRVSEQLFKVENIRKQMEISALKGQINPHFLFNTLNGIYSLAIRDGANATAECLLQLSGLMRYVATETDHDLVSLQKELEYIANYIDLQRIRLDESVKLSYRVEGDAGDYHIAPLLLIPFIENAFKHGVNPDEKSEIDIIISIKENRLHLAVENLKVNHTLTHYEASGLGIEKTKARLNILYPLHDLIINDQSLKYSVYLNLKLDDHQRSHR